MIKSSLILRIVYRLLTTTGFETWTKEIMYMKEEELRKMHRFL